MAILPLVYSETYSFLNTLGEEYINKLPPKLYSIIKNGRDKNYNPIYKKNQVIKTGDLSKYSLAFISMINIAFWCDQSEAKKLKDIYKNNKKK